MGKKLRMLWGAAVGATLQYLYDPQSGRSRRARLKDQAAARLRDVTREIGRKVRYQRGRLRGVAHEMTSDWRGDDQRPEGDVAVLQGIQNAGNSRYH